MKFIYEVKIFRINYIAYYKFINNETKNELEIARLRNKVDKADELEKEIQKLHESIAKLDKQRIEEMRNLGTLS